MTTVNVRIERLDSGDRLYLPNGMWERAASWPGVLRLGGC
jgi:hypothetical protein